MIRPMNLLDTVQNRYAAPALIMLAALVIATGIYMMPSSSVAAGTTDVGCGGDAFGGINCAAGEEVRVTCDSLSMAYVDNDETNFSCGGGAGFYWSGYKGGCRYDPGACSACVPNSGCAANICTTDTCSDSCGNAYTGTKTTGECAPPPPPTCADSNQLGTYPNCYAAPQPTCADYGQLGTYPNCYAAPQPTCADSGQVGTYPNCSAPQSPTVSCTVSPSTITIGGSVTYSANPTGGATGSYTWVASDSTGVGSASTASRSFATAGTYGMNVTGSNTSVSYCPNVTVTGGAPGTCSPGSATLDITATPARVRTGQTAELAWSASNVNSASPSCTVTGPGVAWSSATSAAPSCSASGSATTPELTARSTYTLSCGGQTKTVTVNVIPSIIEI